MFTALLNIRTKQIYRSFIGIGLFRTLFLVVLITFGGFALFMSSSDKLTARLIAAGVLLQIMLVHTKRRDKSFLQSHFVNAKQLMLAEYALLAIPFIGCFAFHEQWFAIAELLLGLPIIVNVNTRAKYSNLNTALQKRIPDDAFEWKGGIRKHFFIIIPVWVTAACCSFFIGSVPIAIFVLGFLTLSFFEESESTQILMSPELSAQKLLKLKIRRQIQLFSVMTIPLIGLFFLFHIGHWYVPVIEYFVFCCLHLYTIVTKYAFYEPNAKSPAAQFLTAIGAVGGIIPVFLPIVWLLSIHFYIKSISNLNRFLNDYN